MNPSLELIYLQDKYLKFNKTGGKNTSIRLPKLPLTSATDVTVEFDHAAMVQGSGKVDDSGVVVVIEGDGQFENGTKYSDVLKVDQPTGTYSWTHSSAKIKGATANTRLVVVMYRVLVKDDSGNYTGSSLHPPFGTPFLREPLTRLWPVTLCQSHLTLYNDS